MHALFSGGRHRDASLECRRLRSAMSRPSSYTAITTTQPASLNVCGILFNMSKTTMEENA